MFYYYYFLVTRNRRRLLEAVGINIGARPRILIERNLNFERMLLRRNRIIERRITMADISELAEPLGTSEAPVIPIIPEASGSGRSIFSVGRPDKSFRSIKYRRHSHVPTRSEPTPTPPIELFDAPIVKNIDDNDIVLIRFDDMNFGRLDDD